MSDDATADVKEASGFLDVIQDMVDDCQEELDEVEENLTKLPMVAMLLRQEVDKEAAEALASLARVHVEATAHTTYLNRPRTLWVLDRDDHQDSSPVTPAVHLSEFVFLVSEATQHLRVEDGPWVWPLHDSDVAGAIALSEVADESSPLWRKALWALRILAPPHGSVLERCVMEHYGREAGYVFAWANLFTRALWPLGLVMLIYGLAGVGPGAEGTEAIPWYSMQLLLLVWGLIVTGLSSSRRAVLRSGAGLHRWKRNPEGARHGRKKIDASKLATSEPMLPGQAEDVGASIPAPTETIPSPPPTPKKRKRKHKGVKTRTRNMLNVVATNKPVSNAKLENVFVCAEQRCGNQEKLFDFRINPEYTKSRRKVKVRIFAVLITCVTLTLFLSLAALVLSLLLQMKTYLIYEWGECIRLRCDNSIVKQGFAGVLADIGVDILMALVFIVGLGECCKAIAFQLARLWNFRLMRTRYAMQTLVALCVEFLAKVGLFMLLAFLFLPSWSDVSIEGSTALPEEVCVGHLDYDLCYAIGQCQASGDPYCCSGTLSCSRQLLPFTSRKQLFENWLVGPFVIAPFIDIIPQLVAPMLAAYLSRLADDEGHGFAGRLCCACCGWLARFLAFIFVLDGEVTGIRYVCLGPTFGPSKLVGEEADEEALENVEGALEQVVLREFDALEEMKELKLSFLFVLLFAPLKPLLVLPTLLARLLEVRVKLTKLFMVKRRGVPRDARLVHGPQEAFSVFAVQWATFWHLGIALVAYNSELPQWSTGAVVGLWFGGGLLGAVLVYLMYRNLEWCLEKHLGMRRK